MNSIIEPVIPAAQKTDTLCYCLVPVSNGINEHFEYTLKCHCRLHYPCLVDYIQSKLLDKMSIRNQGIPCPFGAACASYSSSREPGANSHFFIQVEDVYDIASFAFCGPSPVDVNDPSPRDIQPELISLFASHGTSPITVEQLHSYRAWFLENRRRPRNTFPTTTNFDQCYECQVDAVVRSVHGDVSNHSDPFVKATSKFCPSCNFPSVHCHGHSCHHTTCLNCHVEYCYKCLSTEEENIAQRGEKSKCKCGFWSSFCSPITSKADVDLYLKVENGMPHDIRCGCTICGDCDFQKPCNYCSGACVVCQGIIRKAPNGVGEDTQYDPAILIRSTMPYKNGIYYGDKLFGVPHGWGCLIFQDRSVYEGNWSNGCRNGCGILKFINGDVYEGSYLNDKKSGHGVYKWSDGTVYSGEWNMDKRNGFGKMTFFNGDSYEGHWVNDNRCKTGSFYWAVGSSFTGNWLDDKRNGPGIFKFASGDVYAGNFRDNLFHGFGKYFFADGARYEGEFSNEMMHGKGRIYYINGSVFDGELCQDRLVRGALYISTAGAMFSIDFAGGDSVENDYRVYNATLRYIEGEKAGEICFQGKFSNGWFLRSLAMH